MHLRPPGSGLLLAATAAFLPFALASFGTAASSADKVKPRQAVSQETVAADFALHDLAGREHRLRPAGKTGATVVLFLSTECPISNRYTPRLARWARQVTGGTGKVRVLGAYSNARETAEEIAAHGKERHLPFPLAWDQAGRVARALGATLTPEAVVIDTAGRIRYRGRIDDSDDPVRITHRDLADAVTAVLAGKPVSTARTRAFGCVIQAGAHPEVRTTTPDVPVVTYYKDIAPILQRRCIECHSTGEVAPFALENYAQTAAWAKQIKIETERRAMPPWKAESQGEFLHERRLSTSEIATLSAWVDAGAPEGKAPTPSAPVSAPVSKAPASPSVWKLGEPDAVFEMPVTYTVPADGKDVYRCFVSPTNLDDDKWVSSIEFQPGNRATVHHINIWIDTSGKARKLDAADPEPGYNSPTPGSAPGIEPFGVLGGWLPGHVPWRLPEGVGNLLPKGADIVFEVHYVATGKPEPDRSRFGIRYVQGPVRKRLQLGEVSQNRIRIPAGAKEFSVEASEFVRQDITLLSVTPHMHLLGRKMWLKASLPDGKERELIRVSDWDFNWQLSYRFKEPVKLPRNTRLDLTAIYDNSADNPNNPYKPPRAIREGESTSDEMCNLFVAYTLDDQDLLTDDAVVVP